MSTTTTTTTPEVHPYITEVADRCAAREVDQLFDFYNIGRLICSGEMTYESARDQMVAAFTERDMATSTVKVYVSQGYGLAQLFDTFAELEDHADEECKGSRSLKRIYDSTRVKAEPVATTDASDAAEVAAPESAPMALVDVTIANLAHLSAEDVARVAAACAAILTPAAVAA